MSNLSQASADLLEAARYGEDEEVSELLKQGEADVNAVDDQGRTALFFAAANGEVSIVRSLLERGANVEEKNSSGSTALHWACLNGHKDVVELLLTAGADKESVNEFGKTPIDEAESRGFSEILQVLLGDNDALGADPEAMEKIIQQLGEEGEGEGECEEDSEDEEGASESFTITAGDMGNREENEEQSSE